MTKLALLLVLSGFVASSTTGSTQAVGRACLATGLTARVAFQGAGGAAEGGVLVRNRTRYSCQLGGRPLVDLVAAGSRLPVRSVQGVTTDGRRRETWITLRPGRRGFVHLRWSNWCGSRADPIRLRLWFRTHEPLVRVGGTVMPPRCDNAASDSLLAVGPLEHA